MSSKKKILIIQPIHTAGIKLLENNSDYEFEIVENTDNEFLKSKIKDCPFFRFSISFSALATDFL